ncbi:hypothetical protein DL96DRAFT_1592 [Flagelloscypha sp. PMI_526]|nr:hypothetical protein DL96DRAFT_1592 [Flagelloscypha sp. PMI_526]
MTSDSRLVYQIHCTFAEEGIEHQVIRIFGIFTHAQLERFPINSLAVQLAKIGKTYRQRCNFRNPPATSGDYVVPPALFSSPQPSEGADDEVDHLPELPKEDLDSIHSLLVTEKFLPLSKELWGGIIADLDASPMFDVTPQERKIIEHPDSCYVIGRSGTGKTTTMLFKMFGIEKAYELNPEQVPQRPRQVFVTKSQVLASKVQEAYNKLKESLRTVGKTEAELKVMAMSKDANVDESFMIDDEDEQDAVNLPERFSMLSDQDFPLFLSFNRLCTMLEKDIVHNLNPQIGAETASSPPGFSGTYVSFDVFTRDYWPHFSQHLTKGLSEILVYNEIMGVLKGSEEACRSEGHYLQRSAYEKISHRAQWTFSTQRGVVYTLFEQYLKQKNDNGDFDAADRTHYILKMLEDGSLVGQNIDYLYVDEVQDNLMVDALLMRCLCRNPNGLFWAGDTAQTISVGSSFKFSDLKAFMWRQEQHEVQARAFQLQREQPKTFQLTVNYRSHGGIVSCANSIIALISEFWSNSLDVLAPEKGIVDGEKPVFFTGWEESNPKSRHEQFFLKSSSGGYVEFGAKQCILVRDDPARNKLQAQVGENIGLILTLYESKGLEFDEVILYNFFEDSPIPLAQWRVVLNISTNSKVRPPRFDETIHAGVCNELKFLYVAVTRARKKISIVDESDKGEPMREVWSAQQQIQNISVHTYEPPVQDLSTPEEWREQGANLFKNRLWSQAMHCFERAGADREAAVARAYHLREAARKHPATQFSLDIAKRKHAFDLAGAAFRACAAHKQNTPKESKAYFTSAAESLTIAENYLPAAEAYLSAQDYNSAARSYRQGNRLDLAINLVEKHRYEMRDDLVREILEAVKSSNPSHGFGDSASQADEVFYTMTLELCSSRKDRPDLIRQGLGQVLHNLRQYFVFDLDFQALRQTKYVSKFLSAAMKADRIRLLSEELQDEIKLYDAIYAERRIQDTKVIALRCLHTHKNLLLGLLGLDLYFRTFPDISSSTDSNVSTVLTLFNEYSRVLIQVTMLDPTSVIPIHNFFEIRPVGNNKQDTFVLATGSYLQHRILQTNLLYTLHPGGFLVNKKDLTTVFQLTLMHHLRNRTIIEHNLCLQSAAFVPACIPFIAIGRCYHTQCPSLHGHKDPSRISPDSYTSFIRIHLQEILILHRIPWKIQDKTDAETKSSMQRAWLERIYHAIFPLSHTLGSPASLRSSRISEGREAFQVIRSWCQDILQAKSGHADLTKQLTDLMRLSFLAFFFDPDYAPQYIFESPMLLRFDEMDLAQYHTTQWPSGSVVELMCSALEAGQTDTACITKGIIFIEHVVKKKLEVNIDVLCDFIEYLAGVLILSRGNRQAVTLPRSWVIITLTHVGWPNKDVRGWLVFIETLHVLLQNLVAKEDANLIPRDQNGQSNPFIRAICISRLRRTMGLLAYNIDRPPSIAERAQSLTTQAFNYSSGGSSFVWADVVRAVQQSNRLAVDNYKMCELVPSWEKHSKATPQSVTRFQYDSLDDSIAKKLLGNVGCYSGLMASQRHFAFTTEPFSPAVGDDQQYATSIAEIAMLAEPLKGSKTPRTPDEVVSAPFDDLPPTGLPNFMWNWLIGLL